MCRSFSLGLLLAVLAFGCGPDPTDSARDPSDGAEVLAQAGALLDTDRPRAAARLLRQYQAEQGDLAPDARLLAARAEAGGGDWPRVRTLLDGAAGLDSLDGGRGLYLLARAHDRRRRHRRGPRRLRRLPERRRLRPPRDRGGGGPAAPRARLGPSGRRGGRPRARGRAGRLGRLAGGAGGRGAGPGRRRRAGRGARRSRLRRDTRPASVGGSDRGGAARRRPRRRAPAGRPGPDRGRHRRRRERPSRSPPDSWRPQTGDDDGARALPRAPSTPTPAAQRPATPPRSCATATRRARRLAGPRPDRPRARPQQRGRRRLPPVARRGAGTPAQQADVRYEAADALFDAQRYDEVETMLAPHPGPGRRARAVGRHAAAGWAAPTEAAEVYLDLAEADPAPNLYFAADVLHEGGDLDRRAPALPAGGGPLPGQPLGRSGRAPPGRTGVPRRRVRRGRPAVGRLPRGATPCARATGPAGRSPRRATPGAPRIGSGASCARSATRTTPCWPAGARRAVLADPAEPSPPARRRRRRPASPERYAASTCLREAGFPDAAEAELDRAVAGLGRGHGRAVRARRGPGRARVRPPRHPDRAEPGRRDERTPAPHPVPVPLPPHDGGRGPRATASTRSWRRR